MADVLNYWRLPIDSLGVSVGLPTDASRGIGNDDRDAGKRCVRHVEIIDALLVAAIRLADGRCNWSATGAGLAWSMFRSRYLPSDRHLMIHADPHATQLERAAYLGGHAAIHRTGDITDGSIQLDVNSMYPSVMREAKYPRRLIQVKACTGLSDLESAIRDNLVIAMVRVKALDRAYVLRRGGHLVLAEGEFDTILCGNELAHAVSAGHVTRAWDMAIYEPCNLFSEYVNDLYTRRMDCRAKDNLAAECFCKLLLNSLYGKFGQRSSQWVDCHDTLPVCAFGSWVHVTAAGGRPTNYRAIAWQVQREVDRGEWSHSFPAISAMVTANARQKLWEVTSQLPAYTLYYEDADSLHVSPAGARYMQQHDLIQPSVLGAFREQRRADFAVYYGPRDYVIGKDRIRSSVMWNAEEVSDGTFLQDQCQGLTSILTTEPSASIRVTTKRLHLRRDAYLTRADRDGWIRPLVLTLPTDLESDPGTARYFRMMQ